MRRKKLTQEQKRWAAIERRYERYCGKPKDKWVKKQGSIMGSGWLNLMESPEGFKAWLRFDPPEDISKKYIVLQFPIDTTQEEQRKLLSIRLKK